LLAAASLPFVLAHSAWAAQERVSPKARLAALEKSFGGRIGIFALDTATGARIEYRAQERFAFCSTFKLLLASDILKRSEREKGLLQRHVHYTQGDLVTYSPITEKHVEDGMTVAELCAAALQYSDNTAANQLLKIAGGPAAVTAFARSIGDHEFRLDRWETALNTAIPGDLRDTSTPEAMGRDLRRLVLGDALARQQREQLRDWMLGNTTGAARIRAGVPAEWKVADKTGTGDYGTANDIAVLWPPHRAPIVVAIYTTQHEKTAKASSGVIASAARIVVAFD
jgi:beta-lactamase class A